MPNRNYSIVKIPKTGFDKLKKHLSDYGYSARRREGFILDDDPELFPNKNKSIIQGRYACELARNVPTLEPASLEPVENKIKVLTCRMFHYDYTHHLLWHDGSKGDTDILEAKFAEAATLERTALNIDLAKFFTDLIVEIPKADLEAIRIKDYLGRESLVTTAVFKLSDPSRETAIFKTYGADAKALVIKFSFGAEQGKLTIAKDGCLRFGEQEGFDNDFFGLIEKLMLNNHEAEEE